MDPKVLEKVRAAYDAVAPAYAAQFLDELDAKPFDRALLAGFAELVRGTGPVVEVGTGSGQVARFLKVRGADVFGVDFSRRTVELARERHRDVLRPGAPFLLGFHLGDERIHVEAWLGAKVGLDWRFFPMAGVADALERAGARGRGPCRAGAVRERVPDHARVRAGSEAV